MSLTNGIRKKDGNNIFFIGFLTIFQVIILIRMTFNEVNNDK